MTGKMAGSVSLALGVTLTHTCSTCTATFLTTSNTPALHTLKNGRSVHTHLQEHLCCCYWIKYTYAQNHSFILLCWQVLDKSLIAQTSRHFINWRHVKSHSLVAKQCANLFKHTRTTIMLSETVCVRKDWHYLKPSYCHEAVFTTLSHISIFFWYSHSWSEW